MIFEEDLINKNSKEYILDNRIRFQSFIVFEALSSRIQPSDILAKGEEAYTIFQDIYEEVKQKTDLKGHVLQNRLNKINQMMDLLTKFEDIIVTKFFDKIWRRYTYISNIGEYFITLEQYLEIYPKKTNNLNVFLGTKLDESSEDLEIDTSIEDTSQSKEALTKKKLSSEK